MLNSYLKNTWILGPVIESVMAILFQLNDQRWKRFGNKCKEKIPERGNELRKTRVRK